MAMIAEMWNEFQQLTNLQRRVVFEMHIHGYSASEMAETMGVSERAVNATLTRAEKRIENKLSATFRKSTRQSLVHVREGNGADRSGKGLVTTDAPSAYKAPPTLDRPAVSQKPTANQYYGSPEREPFMDELAHICSAAITQVISGRGEPLSTESEEMAFDYFQRSNDCRLRIAADQADERNQARRLNAA